MKVIRIRSEVAGVAFSISLGFIGIMVVGQFPVRQREAAEAHEEGHILLRHTWKRLRARLAGRNRAELEWLRRQHEHDADAYAVSKGHGFGLCCLLSSWPHEASATHPSSAERVARIHRAMDVRNTGSHVRRC